MIDLTAFDKALLAPTAVLILWSLLVLLWVVVTRFPAFTKAGIDIKIAPAGSRYVEVESMMPANVNWKSHNFTHLMEQPTLFYAVVMVLTLAGDTEGVSVALAWAYVLLRILHSLWQSLLNTLPVRVGLYALSTLCLLGLAIKALLVTLV
jgi:hypothetical protein